MNISYKTSIYTGSTLIIEISSSIFCGVLFFFIITKYQDYILFLSHYLCFQETVLYNKLQSLLLRALSDKNKEFKDTIFFSILERHRMKCCNFNCKCHSYIKFIVHYYNDFQIPFESYKFNKKATIKRRSTRIMMMNSGATTFEKRGMLNSKKNITVVSKEEKEEENLKSLLNLKGEEQKLTFEKITFGIIRLEVEAILAKYPKNAKIRIFYANLSCFFLDNIYKSLYELMKIFIQNQNFMIQYEIFSLKMSIEKKMQKELYESIKVHKDLSMETILLFNNLTNQILDLINSTSLVVIQFWEEILGFSHSSNELNGNDHYSFPRKRLKNNQAIYKYAVQISKNMTKMNSIFKQLRQNQNFFNRIVYKLYAEFLNLVICNEEQGKEIINYLNNRAINIEIKEHDNTMIFSNGKINMDEVGACVISGDLKQLGNILHYNLQFGNIFKYEQKELKLEKINKICPSYISNYHNEFILRYLETGKSHIIGKNKLMFGLRSDGLLVLIVLFVKIVPNLENSVRFIGLVKKVSKSHPLWRIPQNVFESSEENSFECSEINNKQKNSKYVSYILTNEAGKVFGITKNAVKLYGIPLNVLLPPNSPGTIHTNANAHNNTGDEKENSSILLVKENKLLDIKTILHDLNFDNLEQWKNLQKISGIDMMIETGKLKNYYNDFIESLQNSNSLLLKELKHFNANHAFEKQKVNVKLTEILFNNSTMKIKMFKIIKILNKNKIFRHNYMNLNYKHLDSPERTQRRRMKKLQSFKSTSSFQKDKSSQMDDETMMKKQQNNKIKNSLNKFSLPYQITLFCITYIVLLLLILSVSITEYLLTRNYILDLRKFIEMYKGIHQRNFYLILITQNFRMKTLIDNEIISDSYNTFTQNKLDYDMDLLLEIINKIKNSIDTLDSDIDQLHNNEDIVIYSLNKNFEVTNTKDKFSFLFNQYLAKINFCSKEIEKLELPSKNNIFYHNKLFNSGQTANDLTKELFYILENYSFSLRNTIEIAINTLQQKLKSKSTFHSSTRNIICYLPFVFIVISFVIYIFLLGKITDYKISILKVFYVVNKKYGYEIITKCNMFLEYTSNFTKYTKFDIDVVMKELGTNSKDEISDRKLLNSNDEKVSLNSHALLMNAQKNKNAMLFWEREEREKQNDAEEKIIGEKVSNELIESKKELKKKMLMVIIEIIFLFVVFIVYFAITFSFNYSFDNGIVDTMDYIYLFTNRGWVFSNFIFFYREMIISNSIEQTVTSYNNTPLYIIGTNTYTFRDLFYLYMTKSYSIETDILLLTNEFLSGYSNSIIQEVVKKERELNSDIYCTTLKSLNEEFYNRFITDDYCIEYYNVNNGIKDNIQIITSYIQTHLPNYHNKTVNEVIDYLQLNLTFIEYNQLMISLGSMSELILSIQGIHDYIDNYKTSSIIRLIVSLCSIIIEFILYSLIWKYLNKMLIKDKAILNIIPNEAISYSQKVKNALSNLNNFN